MRIRFNSALVIVDLQNDFFPGGARPIPDGSRIIPRVNEYIELFWDQDLPIFASRDWYSPESKRFTTNGGYLPPHCIRDTWGAEFHPDIKLPKNVTILSKGLSDEEAGDSAFWGQDKKGISLYKWLQGLQVKHIYICGLPLETRVKSTAIDALRASVRPSVLIDATQSRGSTSLTSNEEQMAIGILISRGVSLESIGQFRK